MITPDQQRIVRVLALIMRHKSAEPIKSTVIAELAGIESGDAKRVVSEMCSWFYREGWPVGSSGDGFFQTIGEEERRNQYLREIGRAKSIIQKAVHGRKAQADFGTIELFEENQEAA